MRSTFGAGTVAAGGADSLPQATSDTAASAAAPATGSHDFRLQLR